MGLFSRHRSYTERVLAARARRGFALRLLLILAATASFHGFVLRSYRITASSMAPGIPKASVVIASPLLGGRGANPRLPPLPAYRRGDLVIVRAEPGPGDGFLARALRGIVGFFSFQRAGFGPGADSSSPRPSLYRIIGIPGDSLRPAGLTYEVKPEGDRDFSSEFALSGREYSISSSSGQASQSKDGPGEELVELGPEEYFVACDDRSILDGSPLFGPLPRSRIFGRLLALYWPLKSAKFL